MVSLFELFLQPFKINVYRNYCLEWVVSFCLFFKWHIWFGKPCHDLMFGTEPQKLDNT